MLTINELETILYSSDEFKYFKKSETFSLRIITETYFITIFPFSPKRLYYFHISNNKINNIDFDTNINIRLDDIKNIVEINEVFGPENYEFIKDKMDILSGLNRKLKIEKLLC